MFPITGLGAISSSGLNQSQLSIAQMIVNAANSFGVDPAIPLGIASHESGFNPNAINTKNQNGTTDYGVMQLNTVTVSTLGVSDPMDPQQNINAGVGLIAKYLQQYGGDVTTALQAYAVGPGNVAKGNTGNANQFVGYVTGASGQFNAQPILNDVGVTSIYADSNNTAIPSATDWVSNLLQPSTVSLTDSTSGMFDGTGIVLGLAGIVALVIIVKGL